MVSPLSFVQVISQTPDAGTVALPSCGPLFCVATCAVFEEGRAGAPAVGVGALLTCAAMVAVAHTAVRTTHDNFTQFSNSRCP
jgi:hypothetical protein